jgi:hypothetical protein
MTVGAGLLAALAVLAAEPEFTDPAFKGMPSPSDRPRIPAEYHGRWARDLAQCRRKAKVLVITRSTLAGQRVAQVHGYSDHPAIFVRRRLGSDRGLGPAFDISLDGQWLRRSDGFGAQPVLLQRCPR